MSSNTANSTGAAATIFLIEMFPISAFWSNPIWMHVFKFDIKSNDVGEGKRWWPEK